MPFTAYGKNLLTLAKKATTLESWEKLLIKLYQSDESRAHKTSLAKHINGISNEIHNKEKYSKNGCPYCCKKNCIERWEDFHGNKHGADLFCTNCNSQIQVKHLQSGIIGDRWFDCGTSKEQKEMIDEYSLDRCYLIIGNMILSGTYSYEVLWIRHKTWGSHGGSQYRAPKMQIKIPTHIRPQRKDDKIRLERTRHGVKEFRKPGTTKWQEKNLLTNGIHLI
jgi:hypothetical protein